MKCCILLWQFLETSGMLSCVTTFLFRVSLPVDVGYFPNLFLLTSQTMCMQMFHSRNTGIQIFQLQRSLQMSSYAVIYVLNFSATALALTFPRYSPILLLLSSVCFNINYVFFVYTYTVHDSRDSLCSDFYFRKFTICW